MRWMLLIGLVLLTGCGRHKPPAPGDSAASPIPVAQFNSGQESQATADDVYQGRSATQWDQDLQSNDQKAQHEASQALGKLKDKGYPYLFRGMQSTSWETSLICMNAMPRDVMVAHARETLPVVTQLLAHREPTVRRQALLRIGWFGAEGRSAMAHVRRMADNDSDVETRRVAVEVIVGLDRAIPTLIQLLRDPNAEVRKQAVARIQFAGPEAKGALPALRELADRDPDPQVRQAAKTAMELFQRF
ncbi:MAG: HEAT repeat domain-containing protein [Gemmataceae bacterium]|nr:HEAT repeat domain-containing protein [Gemmataceae bacterium]